MAVSISSEPKEQIKMKKNKQSDVVYTGFDIEPLSFEVVGKTLFDSNGFEIPDKKAIFRVDNEDSHYLSTVSANYPIVKNSDIVNKIEAGFNFKDTDVKTILSNNGAVMQRMYTINDYSVEVKKGDEISPVIRIVNSYDGSNAIGFFIDAVRLVCTNGMMSIKQFMSMSYRHFGNKFDVDLFAANAAKLIHGFDIYSNNWKKWTNEPVTEERAKLIENYFPVRFRASLDKRMQTNFDGTKWGLYNSYTEAITHDYTPNSGTTSVDSKKIRLGTEVTKIFNKDWYWKASKEDIVEDLQKRKKIASSAADELDD